MKGTLTAVAARAEITRLSCSVLFHVYVHVALVLNNCPGASRHFTTVSAQPLHGPVHGIPAAAKLSRQEGLAQKFQVQSSDIV